MGERILSLTNHFQDSLNPADELQKAEKMASYKFAGWMGLDKESEKGKMVWQEYEPKTWTEDDVDIKITHCGICGSDLHTLRSGWGPTLYPCCWSRDRWNSCPSWKERKALQGWRSCRCRCSIRFLPRLRRVHRRKRALLHQGKHRNLQRQIPRRQQIVRRLCRLLPCPSPLRR